MTDSSKQITLKKEVKESINLAISNNKNIINLAEEEYEYFKFNEGTARRKLAYILPVIILFNLYSIYTCYRDYGELKYVYKSLYLNLIFEIVSIILYYIPVIRRIYTIKRLDKNNTLLRNYLNKDKLSVDKFNKLNKLVNTAEKQNKRLAKDYLDILDRLPNNTIKKITTLRMISDFNNSIRKFVTEAMSTALGGRKLDEKLRGIIKGIKGDGKNKTTKTRTNRISKQGFIRRLSRKSGSLSAKIGAKERESISRSNAIRKKLEEIDEFKYNPKKIDNIINTIENTPKRNDITDFKKKVVESDLKNKRLKEIDNLRNIGLDCDKKYHELLPPKNPNMSYTKTQNLSSTNEQNRNLNSIINNLNQDFNDINVVRGTFETIKNTVETIFDVDLDKDGKIGKEPIKQEQSISENKTIDLNLNDNDISYIQENKNIQDLDIINSDLMKKMILRKTTRTTKIQENIVELNELEHNKNGESDMLEKLKIVRNSKTRGNILSRW